MGREELTLKDGGDGHKGGHIGDAKVVGALLDGSVAGSSEGTGDELDVGRLIERNTLEAVVGEGREAGSHEVIGGELGKAIAVEGVLEVLEGESIVEDVSYTSNTLSVSGGLKGKLSTRTISQTSLALGGSGGGNGGQSGGGEDESRLHFGNVKKGWWRIKLKEWMCSVKLLVNECG